MRQNINVDRRTVLQAIPATVVGSSVATGMTSTAYADACGVASGSANNVEIVAKHDQEADEPRFELSSRELSAGWTTITFDNQTDHTHLAYLGKLPQAAIEAAEKEDADLLDFYVEHVSRPFQWFMDNLDPAKEPSPDDLSDKYSKPEEDVIFPGWFENVLPSGGAGLTAGHITSRTTVELAPGEYIVDCYLKNDEGEFHSYKGMIDQFTVTENQGGSEPEATLDLSLSTDGIVAPESVPPGQHTMAVQVENQKIYDNLLGHDMHLIRLDHRTTIDDVNGWMNWTSPDQFVSDGTEPGTFLGGVQTIVTPKLLEGAETKTAYFDVNLNPGAYAWVSEVPMPADKGLLKPFSVPFE